MSRRENFVTKSKMPWQVKATPLADYYAEIGVRDRLSPASGAASSSGSAA